jgi:hypothetical protein
MTEHFAYVIAETEAQAYSILRHWMGASAEERRAYEDWQIVFKGEADARYRLTQHLAHAHGCEEPKIWQLTISATALTITPSLTGIPPYAEGDIITVYDHGVQYRAEVSECLLAGAKRPWLVGFESLKTIEPNDSRHYVGTLEANDDGTSPNIIKDPS